jgi:hypothetical protein
MMACCVGDKMSVRCRKKSPKRWMAVSNHGDLWLKVDPNVLIHGTLVSILSLIHDREDPGAS